MRSQIAMLTTALTLTYCSPAPAAPGCNDIQTKTLEKAKEVMLPNQNFESLCSKNMLLFRDNNTAPYTMAIDKNGVIGACLESHCVVPSLNAKETLEYFIEKYKTRVEKGMI